MRFNKNMSKTEKELAFLRDLYVESEWTRRFTELVDKHIDLFDSENLAYLNSGTGGHALILDEKFGEKIDIFATCANETELTIASDKAAAVSAKVDFSCIRFEDDAFDAVLADATLVPPLEIGEYIADATRIAITGGDVAVFLPSHGSFGEVFSLLWELFFTEELADHGAVVEEFIAQLPSESKLESIAAEAGLVNIQIKTQIEIFEYENGEEFVASPLVADFLFPFWFDTLDDDEKDQVSEKLAQLIDSEEGDLSFRFTVKSTLLTGTKEN